MGTSPIEMGWLSYVNFIATVHKASHRLHKSLLLFCSSPAKLSSTTVNKSHSIFDISPFRWFCNGIILVMHVWIRRRDWRQWNTKSDKIEALSLYRNHFSFKPIIILLCFEWSALIKQRFLEEHWSCFVRSPGYHLQILRPAKAPFGSYWSSTQYPTFVNVYHKYISRLVWVGH